jgi:hypothetical protein
MKWIKRKLRQWVSEADYDMPEKVMDRGMNSVVAVSDTNRVDSTPVLNFRIFSAQNGLVLEFHSYNEKTDQRNNSTYIINHGEDIADFVRQSLPIEMLKSNATHS